MVCMTTDLETNKAIVRRFNEDVIGRGDPRAYADLLAPDFVNRTAPPGAPTGPEGMRYTFEDILRPALPDLHVEIHAQIAEGDLVTTRKTLHGTMRGALLGLPPTHEPVSIDVIDVVRIAHGRYAEHWGMNGLGELLARLKAR